MARKPSKRVTRDAMDSEINLLPVLNLMVGLVPPLLLMASFVHLAVIDSSLPKIDQEPPPDQTPPEILPLVVTVELFEDGIKATCTGGIERVRLKEFKRGESTCEPIVIEKVDDEHDWIAFSEGIAKLKANYPEDESVIIRPVDGVVYEDIVNTMDYTRICHDEVAEKEPELCLREGTKVKALLFPNVNLAFAASETGGLIQ